MDLRLSTSAYRDGSNCLKRYEYRWVDGIVPAPRDQSPALRKGLWLHRTLQLADLGLPWLPELDNMAVWAVSHEADEAAVITMRNEVADLTESYLGYWSEHLEERWVTVDTEVPVEYEVAPGRVLTATIDVLKRDSHGRLWIWERKTHQDLPDSDWRTVDPQTMLQLVILKQRTDVQGVVFDYVRTRPAPIVQVKNDGLVYKGCDERPTTLRRLQDAIPQITANWRPHAGWSGPQAYIEWLAGRIVQDGQWFQRYPTLRPDHLLVENMRDVADTARAISRARENGFFRRAWDQFSCTRFCPYVHLCASEYQNGQRNEPMRQRDFVPADQDMWDQGRTEVAA